MSNNNTSDINQILKQLTLTDINDENSKTIKIKNSFIETHQMSGTNTAGQDAMISTNNQITVPYFAGFRPSLWNITIFIL